MQKGYSKYIFILSFSLSLVLNIFLLQNRNVSGGYVAGTYSVLPAEDASGENIYLYISEDEYCMYRQFEVISQGRIENAGDIYFDISDGAGVKTIVIEKGIAYIPMDDNVLRLEKFSDTPIKINVF